MRVRFSEISPFGSHFELSQLEGLALVKEFAVKGPFVARCSLKRKGDDKVELRGFLQATLALECDRCLALYDLEIASDLQILFDAGTCGSWHLKELECKGDDLDTIFLDEPVIDMDDAFRQQMYLAIPLKNLCSEQCQGICSQCGVNLNATVCDCPKESKKTPFSVLGKLK